MKKYVLRRDDHFVNTMKSVAVDLPAPVNISFFWNFGSLLLLLLGSQMVSGVLLATNYLNGSESAFWAMDMIGRDIFSGWATRYVHMSGASMYFLFIYLHMARGLYFQSYYYWKTWSTGVTMFLLSMGSAFLGYVLPWGQMSYWGATVMTKFLSVVPYVGGSLVLWVWGSFSVDYPTLSRFFSIHFLLPLMVFVIVAVHIVYLHETGSKNPLGVSGNPDKVMFYPYFLSKDFLGFLLVPPLLIALFMAFPWKFMEYQKFIQANSLVTPPHIQPEWYFLAAYAVLRAIPSKLGGVVALVLFVVILYFVPFVGGKSKMYTTKSTTSQLLFWGWSVNFLFLTWVGACPVEAPFMLLSRVGCLLYFGYFFLMYAVECKDYSSPRGL